VALDAALQRAGFRFCTLDLGGFASGRLNVRLPQPSVRRLVTETG
jgi:PP-loop superfamily ATP-utilizing enzyme